MNSGVLFALSSYVLWGLFPLYFRLINTVDAFEIIGHRIVWSFAFIMVILAVKGEWHWIKKARDPRVLLVFFTSSVLLACNWGTYVYAIVHDRTLEASLGYFINPLISVALGSLFLKEKLNGTQKICVVLAFIGVAWITWQTGKAPWLGLGMATTFAFYGLIRKLAPLGSLDGLALETAILTPFALGFLLWLLSGGTLAFAGGGLTLDLLLLAAGPITTIPLLLFAAGVRRINYSTVGIIQYVSPTMVFLIGLFLFHEPFSATLFVGYLFIWTAVALFAFDSIRASRRMRRAVVEREARG